MKRGGWASTTQRREDGNDRGHVQDRLNRDVESKERVKGVNRVGRMGVEEKVERVEGVKRTWKE